MIVRIVKIVKTRNGRVFIFGPCIYWGCDVMSVIYFLHGVTAEHFHFPLAIIMLAYFFYLLNLFPAEPLEVLERWVVDLFSSVKKGLQVKPETGLGIPIWNTGKLYWLEAVKDVHVLDLSWTLPSLRKDYTKKAEDYLAHLLGHGKMAFWF